MVGRPLSCDEATFCCSRLDYARVCVEVDAAKPYIHNFEINTPFSDQPLHIEVEYEWKPSRCAKCQLFGHACKPQGEKEAEVAETTAPSIKTKITDLAISTMGPAPKDMTVDLTKNGVQGRVGPDPQTLHLGEDGDEARQMNNHTKEAPTRASKGKAKTEALPDCTVNEVASLLSMSHSVQEDEDQTAANDMTECSTASRDTPPMAFTKVRKKKGCWNIRGINGFQKQKIVHDWITKNKLSLFSLVETKLHHANLSRVKEGLELSHWRFVDNTMADEVASILVGWDPKQFDVHCIHISKQWLSIKVISVKNQLDITVSLIYGSNSPTERQELWEYLTRNHGDFQSKPWILMGDFNATLRVTDSEGGDRQWNGHKEDFGQCLHQCELHSVPFRGIKYTWHNGQESHRLILRKLDWVIANAAFSSEWPEAYAQFLPRGASDHSSMLMHIKQGTFKPKPRFRFLNLWIEREDFMPHIASLWQRQAHGNPLFRLTTKLQWVKQSLKNWHKHNSSHISSRVVQAKADWDSAQTNLDQNPSSLIYRTREKQAAACYQKLCRDEESFYKQKSRIQWLSLGDKNTAFFHKSVIHRKMRNRIIKLNDEAGNEIQDQKVLGQAAVDYYKGLLNNRGDLDIVTDERIFPPPIQGDLDHSHEKTGAMEYLELRVKLRDRASFKFRGFGLWGSCLGPVASKSRVAFFGGFGELLAFSGLGLSLGYCWSRGLLLFFCVVAMLRLPGG
ncbi:hypothetical protein SADUNF_Sadunf07G0000100 [Salix dunnii]|uniref:Endonuclease/exonuclease/phosphatase domain-containing protein n=1 Tax=Salix dunnii TaxID=1413687 RepID=A0A835JYM2_9ROSI|nr:hypothetical protein SADUNF_Sadunf07G0000100 [Salix dunnii]